MEFVSAYTMSSKGSKGKKNKWGWGGSETKSL